MAKDKKSFIFYCDWKHTFYKLSDEEAGIMIKHMLAYVTDENPTIENRLIEVSFEPLKQQLRRDLKKYESICDRNKTNGLKGGRPRIKEEPKKPSGLFGNPKNPDKPDTDNDTDTDTEKNINIEFDVFWNLYGKKIDYSGCKKKWIKLKDAEREKIIQTLPEFLGRIADKQFQPHPKTYLNQRRWDDEIDGGKPKVVVCR